MPLSVNGPFWVCVSWDHLYTVCVCVVPAGRGRGGGGGWCGWVCVSFTNLVCMCGGQEIMCGGCFMRSFTNHVCMCGGCHMRSFNQCFMRSFTDPSHVQTTGACVVGVFTWDHLIGGLSQCHTSPGRRKGNLLPQTSQPPPTNLRMVTLECNCYLKFY